MKLTIKLTDVEAELLAVLDDNGNAGEALKSLVLCATSGVYRPVSWEREWIVRAFGDTWTKKLEPGDPWMRPGGHGLYRRPKRAKRNGGKRS